MTAKKKIDINNETERAYSLIDRYVRNEKDRDELKKGLTPPAITFLLRWEGERDLDMEERVTGIVMRKMQDVYEKDNRELCKSVTDTVCEKVAEVLSPIWVKLESLEKGQGEIKKTLQGMSDRMEVMEKQVFEIDENRLKKLENYASLGWTIIRNAISIIIAVGISVIAFLQIYTHLK